MADFDLAVIGASTAGLSVAAAAAQLGASVVLVEPTQEGGGWTDAGGISGKALLEASHAARAVREAGRFGVVAEDLVIDWNRVRSHVRDVIETLSPADPGPRLRALGAGVLRGEARFIDAKTISVDGRSIIARRFVLATGGRATVPVIDGLERVAYWTNDTLMDLSQKPGHLLILGGGPVGLEMADAFSGLGCRVTLIEANRIVQKEDFELVVGLRRALASRGVVFLEGSKVVHVAPGPVLLLADGRQVAGSHLLVAVGRTPNLESVDLAAANVAFGPSGIATDRGLRSVSNRRVFAVGDVAAPVGLGPQGLAHIGAYHAGVVIRRTLFRLPARIDYSALPRVLHTDPELAQIGLTEAEAVTRGLNVHVLRWPMADNDRAIADRNVVGLVKLVGYRDRIVGAGILAPHAGEMISQWTLAVVRGIKLSALAGMMVPYPTRSEAPRRAVSSFYAPRLFSVRIKALVRLLSRLP